MRGDRRRHPIILPVACALNQQASATVLHHAKGFVPPTVVLIDAVDKSPPPQTALLAGAFEDRGRLAAPGEFIEIDAALSRGVAADLNADLGDGFAVSVRNFPLQFGELTGLERLIGAIDALECVPFAVSANIQTHCDGCVVLFVRFDPGVHHLAAIKGGAGQQLVMGNRDGFRRDERSSGRTGGLRLGDMLVCQTQTARAMFAVTRHIAELSRCAIGAFFNHKTLHRAGQVKVIARAVLGGERFFARQSATHIHDT